MGYDYALVHLYYTIPPAVALTLLFRPLRTPPDVYKVIFLVLVAVSATIPWDSYLIHNNVWTYPSDAIVGPTLFAIPAEELFFFVVQTYTTSLLYLLLSKPTFHPVHLRGGSSGTSLRRWGTIGTVSIVGCISWGAKMVHDRGECFYMGLILVWAGPFILLLWNLAYQMLIGLPWTNTLLPIALPTCYLWIVDTLALKRGTWVIESGTKLGWQLWAGLDIEEAVFFLVTNTLIVFGLVAFDNALAVLYSFPAQFPNVPSLPSPMLLGRAILLPPADYDEMRIKGFQDAISRLRKKSRSFYLASAVFYGRLRSDLVLLYSFCRVADDLVDNAKTVEEARRWVDQLVRYLDLSYKSTEDGASPSVSDFIASNFPPSAQFALRLLPTSYLSPQPFYDLLKGFETDLEFTGDGTWPIKDEGSLRTYASRVAGTVAESCIELVYHHMQSLVSDVERQRVIAAGGRMGIALQYVNIARDIKTDAQTGRVYLPSTWLKEAGLTSQDVLDRPQNAKVEALRQRLLDRAMEVYKDSRPAIENLPREARGPMRVAVESYMEIGRTLRRPGYMVKAGRATVPKLRRLQVAWRALDE